MLAVLPIISIIPSMCYGEIDDVSIGLELNLLTQEQVVSEFRKLVGKDMAAATMRYGEFATRLETASHDDNPQVRSLVSGPDSGFRAELVDIMAANYEHASDDVKEKVLQLALSPLLRDNSFYVIMAVARMQNPHLIGDIVRRHPLYFPGANYYEDDLLQGSHLQSSGYMQAWLDGFGNNYFAILGLALQRDNAANVSIVIDANKDLFEGAAHIIAARHDFAVSRSMQKDPLIRKEDLLARYRSAYVDDFAQMIYQKSIEANWLSLQPPEIQ